MGCSASSQQYPVHPAGNGSAKPPVQGQSVQIQQPHQPYPQQPPPQQVLHQPVPHVQNAPQQQQPVPPQQQPQQLPPQQQQPVPPQQQQPVPPQQQQPVPPQQQQPVPPQQQQPVPPQPLASHPKEQVDPQQPSPADPNAAATEEAQTEIDAGNNQQVSPQQDNNDDAEGMVAITAEDLKQFIEYEKEIRRIENSKAEEHLVIDEAQLKNLQIALNNAEADLNLLKANTEKEKRDVEEFDISNYMSFEKMTIMGPEEARQKELEEYIEAKNKQDVAEKQVERLRNQINGTAKELERQRSEVAKLNELRTKVDGLLENIFNGEYGSELEDRLELESEQLLQYKKHISVAHYKWHSGKALVHHACSQLAYSKRRWQQIQHVEPQYLQARYQMLAEVRGHLIAAHQNIERTREYLSCNLLYFTVEDSQNLLGSINAIVVDIMTLPGYQRALEWYKYYHYRSALLLNWMDQTINNKIIIDHKEASRKFYEKYAELRAERMRCIKERAKGDLGVDLDFGKVDIEDATARIELDLKASESNIAITMDTASSTNMADDGAENHLPPPIEDKESTMVVPEAPKESESGPPSNPTVPLSELAPPPTSEELFGNITELREAHKTQLADFEKAQSVNKTRMDQGLEEKLRARKSKRRRTNLHEEQVKALSKKYEHALVVEETAVATQELSLGGDGNPDVLAAVDNNNAVKEDAIVAAEETGLGGDGNPDNHQQ